MIAKTFGSAVYGVDAKLITIEVSLVGGKSATHISGLPDNAVKESTHPIESTLKDLGLRYPR